MEQPKRSCGQRGRSRLRRFPIINETCKLLIYNYFSAPSFPLYCQWSVAAQSKNALCAVREMAPYRQIYRRVRTRLRGLLALDLTHRWFATAIGVRNGHVLQRNDGIHGLLQGVETVFKICLTVSRPPLVVTRTLHRSVDTMQPACWLLIRRSLVRAQVGEPNKTRT